MKIETIEAFKKTQRSTRVMQRTQSTYTSIMPRIEEIFDAVKKDGDAALMYYTRQFDGVSLQSFTVSSDMISSAYELCSPDLVRALKQMKRHIIAVHSNEYPAYTSYRVKPIRGIRVYKKWLPIECVGIYVPGGNAVYPSTVLMNSLPAKIAGVKKIIMTTPPNKDGKLDPSVLVAADIAGVDTIYMIGGAQAIAAMSLGTQTIQKVSKIVGPGNAYVTAAKLKAYERGLVAIDGHAGPSEVCVLADETANPRYVAADLIADAEHGPDSAPLLVSTSATLLTTVIDIIPELIKNLSTKKFIESSFEQYGLFALAPSLNEAITFVNDYAAEHLLIMTKDARSVSKHIVNAGSVFIGDYTAKSAGDYATGANHVLPTGGSAKMFSGLSVLDFMHRIEYQEVKKSGLKRISKTIQTLSIAEGLPGHGLSARIRL